MGWTRKEKDMPSISRIIAMHGLADRLPRELTIMRRGDFLCLTSKERQGTLPHWWR
jgi:hypothetical protein